MAIQCPQCSTLIEEDFGVVTCSHCQNVFSVGIDGEVVQEFKAEVSDFGGEFQAGNSFVSVEAPVESEQPVTDLAYPELQNQTVEEFQEDFIRPIQETNELPVSNQLNISDSNVIHPIGYDLLISEIDTAEIHGQVIQALNDSRFPWTAQEMAKEIKGGMLRIGSINPVVASVVVSRLQEVSVKISWEQKIYE